MAEPMNLAYLILAHHQPQHLARLIRNTNAELARYPVLRAPGQEGTNA